MSQTVTKLHFAPAPLGWQARVALAWHRISAAWQLAATRRHLSQLDDRMLSDIGDFPRPGRLRGRSPGVGARSRQLSLTSRRSRRVGCSSSTPPYRGVVACGAGQILR